MPDPLLAPVPGADHREVAGVQLDIVKAGAASVASKSPAEAAAYKATILAVAKAAAEASKEGGFLGIGGTLVSKDEQAALDQLSAALA